MTYENLQSSTKPEDEEPLLFRAWRWWKLTWTGIRNVLYVSLVLLAFEKATSGFENVVLCLLVLTLQSVNWGHTTQLRLTVEEALYNRRLLLLLLKGSGEDVEEAGEIVIRAEKEYLKGNPMYYINLTGASVVYLIIIWKLFTTLMS